MVSNSKFYAESDGLVYLHIFGIFNDVCSSSDHTVSSDIAKSVQWGGKDVKTNGSVQICVIVPSFDWVQ